MIPLPENDSSRMAAEFAGNNERKVVTKNTTSRANCKNRHNDVERDSDKIVTTAIVNKDSKQDNGNNHE